MGIHHRHWSRPIDEEEEYFRQTNDRELVARLLTYTWRMKRHVLLLGFIVLATTILNLIPPYLFSLAIDIYIANVDVNGLALLVLAFIGFIIILILTGYGHSYLISWLGAKLEYNMRMDLFQHLQTLSPGYFAKREVGGLVSRITNDVEKITELVSSGVVEALANLVTLVGITAIMLWMSPWLSMISFTVIPLIVLFIYFWGRRVRTIYRQTRKTIASVSAKIEESVSGMKEIQSFSREQMTHREFREINISNMQANVEAGRIMSAFQPIVNIFSALGNFLILWFGGNAVIQGTLTVGVLFAFMSYITQFFWPIQSLSNFWNQVQSALAAAERIFHTLDTEPEIQERPEAIEIDRIKGRITFEDVTFSYEPGQPVLRNINLQIEPNTTVALVGPTGAGKTTMVNLLYRFYDPQRGRITVDSHDLRDLKTRSLREQMAIVLQDPFLFSGTVRENIKYGNPNASDEKIIALAKAAGAHEFIQKLPEGYNTEVRERGSRLSMGQRQLISLVRALIVDPRILLMDEATSSIDALTELVIKQTVEKALKNRTSIVIAHRLSTVRNADLIVVLEEGKIVEQGTHKELLRKGGLYQKLYKMQFRYETQPEPAPASYPHTSKA